MELGRLEAGLGGRLHSADSIIHITDFMFDIEYHDRGIVEVVVGNKLLSCPHLRVSWRVERV